MSKDSIETRLRFHGRFGAEDNDKQAIRKHHEREEAATVIDELRS